MLLLLHGLTLAYSLRRHQRHFHSTPFFAEGDFYSAAIRKASDTIRKRFFFPGHGARRSWYSFFVENPVEDVTVLDLPELDETDNIHSPEVS